MSGRLITGQLKKINHDIKIGKNKSKCIIQNWYYIHILFYILLSCVFRMKLTLQKYNFPHLPFVLLIQET